ncbi:MAG: PEP-CTERM sorting domain-containing protein [Bryobacterales bacterium]|nr:PEP-CTERM sorting domain-containing protein [Bryobacterales bacterium]
MSQCPVRSQQHRRSLLACVVALLTVVVSPLSGGTITYEDTNFYDEFFGPNAPTPDWYIQTVEQAGPITGQFYHTGTGNPGPGRLHAYSIGASSGTTTLIVGHYNPSFVWDPSVDGAVGELEFSYDIITTTRGSGGFRPALRQDGVIFYLSTVLHSNDSLTDWMTFTAFSGNASEWLDISGLLNPDFSSSGSLIEFGYRTGLGSECLNPNPETGLCSAASFRSALDNYRVTIRSLEDDGGEPGSIPEPSTAAMLSGILLAGALYGYRRKRRFSLPPSHSLQTAESTDH